MNKQAILTIVYKDMKIIAQNKQSVLCMIIIPFIMLAIFPALAVLAPAAAKVLVPPLAGLEGLPQHLPASVQAELAGFNSKQRWDFLTLVYFLAPVYLVVPLTTASSIAADSFVGERERKSIEALFYTPTTDQEIFLAKLLSPWLIGMGLALIGFLLYTVVANVVAWPDMHRVFFPNLMWIILVLWVAPAAAVLGLSTMELVSVHAKSVQEASQLGSAIVIPLLLLMFVQAIGIIYLNLWLAFMLGLLLWITDGALLWLGSRIFRRHVMMTRL
jgi:ABC-type transport system involved in multi-copper enzyme maturation permease subunit